MGFCVFSVENGCRITENKGFKRSSIHCALIIKYNWKNKEETSLKKN
jgi:hypothetical protein